jgi:rubrerythrin
VTVPEALSLYAARVALAREEQPEDAALGPRDGRELLIDLCSERLAVERTATRLYEALLAKHAARDGTPGGPSREALVAIHDEELEHVRLLAATIARLGGDPTRTTPSADLAGVATSGLIAAITDVRSTFDQGLKFVLAAELADADSWETLAEIAARIGQPELARELQAASTREQEHVALVRTWMANALEAGTELEPEPALGTPL